MFLKDIRGIEHSVGSLKIGTVVYRPKEDSYATDKNELGRWGHIIGFSRNPSGELILTVRWEKSYQRKDGEAFMETTEYDIHPSNIVIHSGYI